ncbi:MAG: hypothetical protein ACPG8W_13245 [Candidatus Promineifilaceae bacterium]
MWVIEAEIANLYNKWVLKSARMAQISCSSSTHILDYQMPLRQLEQYKHII